MMKHYVDKGRSERTFNIEDQVNLKLQPYRKTTVARRPNQKLSTKFFGSYQALRKIGLIS